MYCGHRLPVVEQGFAANQRTAHTPLDKFRSGSLSFELVARFPLHSRAFPSDYPRGNGRDGSRFPEARASVNPFAIADAVLSTLQAPIAGHDKTSIRRAVGSAYARRVREPTSLPRARPPPSQAPRAPCFGRPAARKHDWHDGARAKGFRARSGRFGGTTQVRQ